MLINLKNLFHISNPKEHESPLTFPSQLMSWRESSGEKRMLKMICRKMLKLLNFIFHSFSMLRAAPSRWKNFFVQLLMDQLSALVEWNFCKSSWWRREIWYQIVQVHSERRFERAKQIIKISWTREKLSQCVWSELEEVLEAWNSTRKCVFE